MNVIITPNILCYLCLYVMVYIIYECIIYLIISNAMPTRVYMRENNKDSRGIWARWHNTMGCCALLCCGILRSWSCAAELILFCAVYLIGPGARTLCTIYTHLRLTRGVSSIRGWRRLRRRNQLRYIPRATYNNNSTLWRQHNSKSREVFCRITFCLFAGVCVCVRYTRD